jgi:hypothetical protein
MGSLRLNDQSHLLLNSANLVYDFYFFAMVNPQNLERIIQGQSDCP